MPKEMIVAPEKKELVNGNTGEIIETGPSESEIVQKVKVFLDAKPKKIFFNKRRYPEFDDWQYIANFYGLRVKTFDPRFTEIGSTKGFHAKAMVLDSKQNEVGRAEAYCMDDEPNWRRKPLFQLASMAQTRAAAKALSNLLRPIAVLSGLEGTPGEEMDADAHEPTPPTPAEIDAAEEPMTDKVAAKPKPDELQYDPPPPGPARITEKQAKLIFARTKAANIPLTDLQNFIQDTFGVSRSANIPRDGMDQTLKWIDEYHLG